MNCVVFPQKVTVSRWKVSRQLIASSVSGCCCCCCCFCCCSWWCCPLTLWQKTFTLFENRPEVNHSFTRMKSGWICIRNHSHFVCFAHSSAFSVPKWMTQRDSATWVCSAPEATYEYFCVYLFTGRLVWGKRRKKKVE